MPDPERSEDSADIEDESIPDSGGDVSASFEALSAPLSSERDPLPKSRVTSTLAPVSASALPSAERRRSSIRPASPDWRPRQRSSVERPRPMVVVYSGDSDRPPRWWDDERMPSEYERTPAPPEPMLSRHELRPPPTPNLGNLGVPLYPRGSDSDVSRITASVALSGSEEVPRRSLARRVGPLVMVFLGAAAGTVAAVHGRHLGSIALSRSNDRADLVHVASAVTTVPNAAERPSLPPTSSAAGREPAQAPSAAASPVASAAAPSVGNAATSPVASAEATSVASAAPSAVQKSASTAVVLEVLPPDSLVALNGIAQSGPPFVFHIRQGESIMLELVHKGYASRRLVLDGSDSHLLVGLLPKKSQHPAKVVSRATRAADSTDPVKGSELRIQSGL